MADAAVMMRPAAGPDVDKVADSGPGATMAHGVVLPLTLATELAEALCTALGVAAGPTRPVRAPQPMADGTYPGAALSTFAVCRIARICVCEVLRVDPLLLTSKARGARKMAAARQLAMHLAHIVAGRSHEDVAHQFGRNRSTASHHFEVMEWLRDSAGWDGWLGLLEHRYSLLLQLACMPMRQAWLDGLAGLTQGMEDGTFEGDAYSMADYLTQVFQAEAQDEAA